MAREKFVLFGDSLTQQSFDVGGWGARLANLYQRKADIILRGYSGYNTRWAKHTVQTIFPSSPATKYAFATIFFGANDAALPEGASGRQHVPLEEYEENLRQFADILKGLGAKVLIVTPPPIDEAARIQHAIKLGQSNCTQPERTLEGTKLYAGAAKKVAEEGGMPCLDLWTEFQKNPDWQMLLSDGLHFTAEGNAKVFELLVPLIDNHYPHLREEAMSPDFPWHGDIDADSPQASFDAHGTLQVSAS